MEMITIHFPKKVKSLTTPPFKDTRPVTHVALVAVNNASTKSPHFPVVCAIGVQIKKAPTKITRKKEIIDNRNGDI